MAGLTRASVKPYEVEGCVFWKVTLWEHAGEDGWLQYGVLMGIQVEQAAKDAAAFWETGGAQMVRTLCNHFYSAEVVDG